MKYVICYIDSIERLNFFKRINKQLTKNFNTEIIFVTAILSIYLKAKIAGHKAYLTRKNKAPLIVKDEERIKSTIQYRGDFINEEQCKVLYNSIFLTMEKVISSRHRKDFIGIFNWNGGSINSKASESISQKYNIPILFFEIGNFKDKIFVDKLGTNSDSSIAKNPELLLSFKSNKEAFTAWKKSFTKSRQNLKTIPQAKRKDPIKTLKTFISNIIDELGVFAFRTPRVKSNIIKRVFDHIKSNTLKKKIQKLCISKIPERFVFLPLQVSIDTNLLIRSNVDNFKAIEIAYKYAEDKKLPLIIKTHPADRNPIFLEELYNYIKEKQNNNWNVIVSNINAFILATKAEKVFTINSTLGLEAIIYGIDNVEILGNALYKNWNEEHIKHYVTGFLIHAPYFINEEISKESVRKILKRLRDE